MAKTPDKLMEAETVIRWDEASEVAVLWTASAKVRREWESFGFPVEKITHGRVWGWRVEVPVDRITYRPVKKR